MTINIDNLERIKEKLTYYYHTLDNVLYHNYSNYSRVELNAYIQKNKEELSEIQELIDIIENEFDNIKNSPIKEGVSNV